MSSGISPGDIADLITRHLADPQASWAIGTFGAIAEFHRDADEEVILSTRGALTPRGGIRLGDGAALRVTAWECPSSGDSWTHGVALCLPEGQGAMSRRTVVTEVGLDAGALREAERDEVLFDLGIGAPHCDACVRTADLETLCILRTATGQKLLECGLFRELSGRSPTRVFLSRLGRIEVRTQIPGPEDRTPNGPHTHVLPDLLRSRRTHSANLPLPEGVVPCAEIYPASAIHDAHGKRRQFDAAKHETFQALLDEYGDPLCLKAKRETIAAIRKGGPPLDEPSYTRAQRLARRVAIRQFAQVSGSSRTLSAWSEAFDSSKANGQDLHD